MAVIANAGLVVSPNCSLETKVCLTANPTLLKNSVRSAFASLAGVKSGPVTGNMCATALSDADENQKVRKMGTLTT